MPETAEAIHVYEPNPKQIEAHSAAARFTVYGGGVGSGKSRWLVEDWYAHGIKNPGSRSLLGRYNLIDLRRTTEQELLKMLDKRMWEEWGGKRTITPPYYRLPNGSELYLTSLMDIGSWLSAELSWVGIDECDQVSHEVPDMLDTRMRWTTQKGDCERPECRALPNYRKHSTHPRYQIRMACNPNPRWPKKLYYDPWSRQEPVYNQAFVLAKTEDNVTLPPDYEYNLRLRHNPTWVRRMLDGDWTAFEGAIFEMFNRGMHVWRDCSPLERTDNHCGPLPNFKHVVGSIDYGAESTYAHRTTAYLTGEMDDGRRLTFWEYSEQGSASGNFWDVIAQANRVYEPTCWYADASQGRTKGLAVDRGITIEDAARWKGSRNDGITLMVDLLFPRPGVGPMWFIHERCPRLIEALEIAHEVPAEKALQGYGEVTKEMVRRDDDEIDGVRYGLMGMHAARPAIVNLAVVVNTPGSRTQQGSRIMTHRRQQREKRLADFLSKPVFTATSTLRGRDLDI